MPQSVSIDPVTRIEGHLGIKVDVENGLVSEAWCAGESYRGFEQILVGRDPRDAQLITQRICGVCPIEHGVASVLAQDMAFGVLPPTNGRLSRNLMAAANFIQSHILHFYTLSAVDFIDITAVLGYRGSGDALASLRDWVRNELSHSDYFPVAPLLPRFAGAYLDAPDINLGAMRNYVAALDARTRASRLAALFGGKIPHAATLMAGGVTQPVTGSQIVESQKIVQQLCHFIETCYLPDVMRVAGAFPEYFEIGAGPDNYLAFGAFHEANDGSSMLLPPGVLLDGAMSEVDQSLIAETVATSKFTAASGGHPYVEGTAPQPAKNGAYSWLKAPRFAGHVMETGPLARMKIASARGDTRVVPLLNQALASLGRTEDDLNSVMGRHLARALECKMIAARTAEWVAELQDGGPVLNAHTVPVTGEGYGLTEAARGALGHWMKIEGGVVSNYQCVVPTTWNCSPRDDLGQPGALEQALVGTPVADPDNPLEAVRVVRSFDPCLSCAVH